MVLKNRTKNSIITTDLKEASSLSDRALGLLKTSNPRSLLFRTRFGLHTFGLREPIDVLVLDDQLRVVKVAAGLKPNRLFFWPPRFSTVVELPAGSISNSTTTLGDQILLET